MFRVIDGWCAVRLRRGWCGLTALGYCSQYRHTSDRALQDAQVKFNKESA
jgi:hypothetical protein